jgi:16S rRNA (guanine527-N7)-methyltransferase
VAAGIDTLIAGVLPPYTAPMRDLILKRLGSAGLALGLADAEQLAAFLELLARWNRVHNLTAVTDPEQMIRRHLSESLVLREFLRGVRIADVGSGAGLPGIPLAIVEPDREFTLIESRAKRARFLSHVKGALNLSNVTIEHSRVEDLRGMAPFDTVLARAVAALPELIGLTEHLLGSDSVLLVLTKADIGPEASAVDKRYTVRRLDSGVSHLLEGALVAIERAAR